jgi:hypothetical protein
LRSVAVKAVTSRLDQNTSKSWPIATFPPIQLTNLLQQRLLWIRPAYAAGVRTVMQDQ